MDVALHSELEIMHQVKGGYGLMVPLFGLWWCTTLSIKTEWQGSCITTTMVILLSRLFNSPTRTNEFLGFMIVSLDH